MISSELSADGLISFVIAALVAIYVFFSWVHHERENFLRFPSMARFVAFCGRRRDGLTRLLQRGYELRFVSLFILLAMIVSTISPVSALLEMEENILSRACEALSSARALAEAQSPATCEQLTKTGGYSLVATSFLNSKNHLLQIALWPLVALLYGLAASIYVWFSTGGRGKPTEHVFENATHAYHTAHAIGLIVSFIAAGLLQNRINT